MRITRLTERRGKATAAHIGFEAPSRKAVNAFFAAALKAGGRIHGEPASRDPDREYYSAAILDFDGNSIEVIYRGDHSRSMGEQDRGSDDRSVLAWQRDVAKSTAPAPERSPVEKSTAHVYVNNVAKPSMVVTQTVPAAAVSSGKHEHCAKALVGTLLGAAAGAAVAYAMTKAEAQDAQVKAATQTITYRTVEGPPPPTPQIPEQARSTFSSRHSCSPPGSAYSARTPVRALDYEQADRSIVSQDSMSETPSARRSHTKSTKPPQLLALPASTLIETFVPPSEVPRYPQIQLMRRTQTDSALESVVPSHPSRRAKTSRASSAAETVIPAGQWPSAPQPPPSEHLHSAINQPLPSSKATSMISRRSDSRKESEGASYQVEVESVAPSDSISQVGSTSKRSKASKRISMLKSEINAEDVRGHVSVSTVKGPSHRAREGRGGSAASLPLRPSNKVSAHRSVKSFIPGM